MSLRFALLLPLLLGLVPAIAAQDVTPTSGSTTATANTTGNQVTFTVTTGGSAMFGWTVECGYAGQVTTCSTGSFDDGNPNAQSVVVTYSVGSAGSGSVWLTLLDGMFEVATGTYAVQVGSITYGVSVTPDGGTGSAYVSTTGNTTTFTITNTGTAWDAFSLSCAPAAPVTSCTGFPSTVNLADNGGNTTVTVSYNTSSSTGTGGLTFTADGQGSSTAYDQGSRNITVSAPPVYGVSVTPDGGTLEKYTDGSMTATVIVNNTGNTTETFTIGCLGTGSVVVSCSGLQVPIGPYSSAPVPVEFSTSSNAGGTLTVSATSPNASDNASFTLLAGFAAAPNVVAPTSLSPVHYGVTDTVTFTLYNQTVSLTEQYDLSCFRSGQFASCTVLDSPTIPPSSSAPVRVRVTRTSVVGTGTVGLDASLPWCCTARTDKDSVTGWVSGDLHAPALALERYNPHLHRDYGLCVTASGGPGVQLACGTLIAAHAMPSYRTLGRDRSLTVVYNGATASIKPGQAIRVQMLPTQEPPDSLNVSIQTQATVGGPWVTKGSATYAAWLHSNSGTRQVVTGWSQDGLASGVYPFRIIVRALYPGIAHADTVVGEVVVVNRRSSPFGSGWWVGGVEELVLGADRGGKNRIVWVGGDGSYAAYDSVAVGIWVRPAGAYRDTLVRVGSEYRRRLLHGDSVAYTSAGRHSWTKTRAGHVTSFMWTSTRLTSVSLAPSGAGSYSLYYTSSLLDSIADPAGRRLRVSRSGAVVTAFTDPDGAVTAYGSDGARRIVRRTTPRGYTTAYTWGWGKQLNRIAQPLSGVAGDSAITTITWTDAQGQTLDIWTGAIRSAVTISNAYTQINGPRTNVSDIWNFWEDMWGAPIRVVNPFGVSDSLLREDAANPALVTRTVSADGAVTRAWYNTRGLPESVRNEAIFDNNGDGIADGGTPAGNAVFATTRFVYDPQWNLVTRVVPPTQDSVVMQYDAGNGNLLWQQDARGSGSRVTFTYHPTCGLISAVQQPGITGRDSLGYDGRCNVTYSRTAAGIAQTLVRGATGLDSAVTEPGGRIGRHLRDVMGRDTLVRLEGTPFFFDRQYDPVYGTSYVSLTIPAETVFVASKYDVDGNLIRTRRSMAPEYLAVRDSVVFDAAGRMVERYPNGAAPGTPGPERWTYDQAGNVLTWVTRRGHTITMTYDAAGQMITRTVPAVTYGTESHGGKSFPRLGSTLAIPQDAQSFGYDAVGRMVRADNRWARVRRGYSRAGLLTGDTLITHKWDGVSGSGEHVYGLTLSYDLGGRRASLQHPSGIQPSGAVPVRYHYAGFGAVDSVIGPNGEQFGFRYDLAGRLDSIAYPNNTGIRFWFDDDGQPVRRRAYSNYTGTGGGTFFDEFIYRNNRGLVDSVWQGPYYNEFRYTSHGGVAVSEEGYIGGAGRTLSRAEWTKISALGNRSWVRTYTGPGPDIQLLVDTSRFLPLEGWRLRHSAPLVEGSYAYPPDNVYDSDGNQHLTQRWRLHSYCASGNALLCFQYSSLYYRETSNRYYAANEQMFVSDVRSDAINASLNSVGGYEEFRYDALGRRVLRRYRSDGIAYWNVATGQWDTYFLAHIERYVWDGDQILYEIRAAGSDTSNLEDDNAGVNLGQATLYGRAVYVHGPGLDQPLMVRRADLTNGDKLFLYSDWRGQISYGSWNGGWIDDVGDISFVDWQARRMSTWADRLSMFQPHSTNTTWMGSLLSHQRNETRDVYMRNRYYDPTSGRFTQTDPIGLAGGANTYGFAGGDPVNFSDPFGLCPWCIGGAIGALAGAGYTLWDNHRHGRPLSQHLVRNTLVGTAAGATLGLGYQALAARGAASLAAGGAGAAGNLDRLVAEAQAAATALPGRIYALGQSVGRLRMGADAAMGTLEQGIMRLGGEFSRQVIDNVTYLVGPQARNGVYNGFRVLSDGQVERARMQFVEGAMKVIR